MTSVHVRCRTLICSRTPLSHYSSGYRWGTSCALPFSTWLTAISGYRQYNSRERQNDFTRAYLEIIDAAIGANVDFVLLAGDLFERRAIDPITLSHAITGLERLE